MKKHLLLILLGFSLGFTSCTKKDKDPDPTPVVPADPADDPAAIQLSTQLLTANQWVLTSLTQNVPGQAIYNDIYNNSFPACQHDDIYTFSASNHTVTIAPGLTTCSASDAGKTGNWDLKNAKTITITIATLTQAGLTGEFTITMLDNSKMILTQTINGSQYIATYEKQIAYTKTQLLTARPWLLTAATTVDSYNGNVTTTDNYAAMGACSKDNLLIFGTNGIATSDEGPTKCNVGDPQTETANWTFANNETQLVFTFNGSSSSNEILTLSATTLTLRTSYTFQGNSSVSTSTYTAQ